MVHHLVTGREGEELAEKYLEEKGCKILGRNVKTKSGEIDLIAKHRGTLVFVEVKARSKKDCVFPSERVNARKIKRLQGAAEAWLAEEYERGAKEIPARLDVIGVCEGVIVEHYENVTG